MKKLLATLGFWLAACLPGYANVPCTVPFNLTNGTTADATQVMANYNAILSCLTQAAASGVNSDITQLTGLTSPFVPASGGTPVFLGGTSTGSSNAYVVSTTVPNNFSLTTGYTVIFKASFTNTGATTLAANGQAATAIFKQTPAGPVAMAGGEIVSGQIVGAVYDGTQFEMLPPLNVSTGFGLSNIITIASVTVATGGSGCSNGSQTFTIVGGSGTAATFSGTVSSGSLVGALVVVTAGQYTTAPSAPATTTGAACGTQPTVNFATNTPSVSISSAAPPYGFDQPVNMGLTAVQNTPTANLLQVCVTTAAGATPTATNPVLIPFPNNGLVTWLSITGSHCMNTNAAGATLGSQNSVPFRFWIAEFNNAGTPVLSLWHSGAGAATPVIDPLDETSAQSSTAISGGATSAGVFYTPNGTTVATKQIKILGYLEYNAGLATAGSYSSAPTKIQLFGPGVKKPGDYLQNVSTSGSSTGTITPTSAINLVEYSIVANLTGTTAVGIFQMNATGPLKRNGTTIETITVVAYGSAAGQQTTNPVTWSSVDNPASTSAQSYVISGTGNFGSYAAQNFTLKEVQG
jgi:hypothetical protein